MTAKVSQVKGKRVVVTGAGRGIGRAVAAAFLDAGAQVIGCGRSAQHKPLPGLDWLQADVSERDDVSALAAEAMRLHGGVDVLVNNAGVQVEKTVVDSSDADFDLVIGTNVRGVFACCRAFIPIMRASGGGVIVNIGSISGNHADPGLALYNGSKAFVHGLTRSIAVDHGAEGIRCNAICPGWIDTGMADAAFAVARDPAAARADALARHPAGRFGQPEDIANAALWLASDAATFISGQTLTVDGGMVAASPVQPGLY